MQDQVSDQCPVDSWLILKSGRHAKDTFYNYIHWMVLFFIPHFNHETNISCASMHECMYHKDNSSIEKYSTGKSQWHNISPYIFFL